MLLNIELPHFGGDAKARVRAVHVREGDHVSLGVALLDVSVDFSAGISFDCPPVSHFRVLSREAGWLLRLTVARGGHLGSGTTIGLLGTTLDADPDEAPARPARLTVASVLEQDAWWDLG